ncbi:ABC transporter ATP-binding protein [Pseudoalteromonas sp. SR44-5]|jgi:ABC-2 type transport system ATP-binding protein|uniref:ABC transporter ATP-binding protein n=2 Tax=Pseudoalteromonas TaxID=53246 RepID=A0ABY3FFN3_9GAMM|nr:MULTISPECIES: ABC transporter ATP-binding protein [Pseudoalteromonas]MBB1293972.1 ABC transporter ATP-binding protein [Pseudoalteromonas sp. SR41-4]MBB1302007.1 ABC transporter ATP-binding protein [Pseudoalteromonas sp. SR44-8]MBB1310532.1 ABC transporter ATP-binding protein [Pseudoalteromonas sp. SR41-8]MBB1333723.1 ABC transporter ATP-binding protein [Pseudoalteromonas sp. SR41-6]MBB1341780.1 ABC transporter ATP-binding protein [Pseudoalteromonas sp. SR45-6]|tara:strand:+ start:6296 stop:7228 length:933 start_codon:yes stop_codon:yes gene_type:complete
MSKALALNIEGLTKVYKNGVEAVKGVDLKVYEGDFFALLGPNGAGKSTTIGVISSLVNKTKGLVEVFGHNIDSDLEAAKSQLGLVPQEFNFSQFETLTQILVNQAGYYGVPRKVAHQRADKYLAQLGLLEKKDKQARTLSGGMKRRLMIARALMHEPKLLILDEPTAGVDIELRRSMWDFLRQINEQGVTIILTTHYLEEAELLCKNIAIIDSGIIVENTTIKALLAKLDKETFILDLKQPVQPVTVTLDGYKFTMADDHTIEVEVAKSQGLNAVFTALTEQGNTVLSMRNKANRLEELFVGLLEQGRGK